MYSFSEGCTTFPRPAIFQKTDFMDEWIQKTILRNSKCSCVPPRPGPRLDVQVNRCRRNHSLSRILAWYVLPEFLLQFWNEGVLRRKVNWKGLFLSMLLRSSIRQRFVPLFSARRINHQIIITRANHSANWNWYSHSVNYLQQKPNLKTVNIFLRRIYFNCT